VKEECLEKLILFGEGSLRRALTHFIDHFHGERNHQGKWRDVEYDWVAYCGFTPTPPELFDYMGIKADLYQSATTRPIAKPLRGSGSESVLHLGCLLIVPPELGWPDPPCLARTIERQKRVKK
jgi:hypothetical protein